ncbi:transmembrane protein [Cystoisospora suis]|uniref:Transmembrane protein n=1 Tax=Cystoisospora suis TaxID=483139 RepID=A0A2C6KPZ0_9APIC|nr:transmembrane protein [Cystoisospora suis]
MFCCTLCEPDRDECGCRWWRLYGCVWWCSLLMSVASLGLTLYGEHHYAEEMHALQPLLKGYVPSPCSPLPVNDRKLVHIDCPLTELDSFFAPSAFSPNVAHFTGVFFETRAEVYQNTQKVGRLGPYIAGDWVDHLVDFSQIPSMLVRGQPNPAFFPVIPGRGRVFSTSLKAGGFSLPAHMLTKFSKKAQLQLIDDGYYEPSDSRPPMSVDYKNTQVKNNALYTGDPNNPRIGDVRVTFWGSMATHVSLIGLQTVGFLGNDRYIHEFPAPALQNRTVAILAEGDYSPEALIAEYVAETHASNKLTWLLRVITVLLIWFWLFITAITCSTNQSACFVFFNCGLFALAATAGAAGFIWWQFDSVVAVALWVLSGGVVLLAVATWIWDFKCDGESTSGTSLPSPSSGGDPCRSVIRWAADPSHRNTLESSLINKNEAGDTGGASSPASQPRRSSPPLVSAASFQL